MYIWAPCISQSLGPKIISIFHASTGCDTVSAFHGKGKKLAWNAWALHGEFTDVLAMMMHHQQAVHLIHLWQPYTDS